MQANNNHDEATENTNITNYTTRSWSVAATAVLVGCLVWASGCAANRSFQSFVFDGAIEDVLVDLDSGDVIVTGTDDEETRVEVDLICRGGTPEYDVEHEGGKVSVTGRAGWAGEEACDGTVRIAAPRNASLDVSVARGDVAVKGVEGEVAVETFAGDIECDAPTHLVEIKTDTTAVAAAGPSVFFQ